MVDGLALGILGALVLRALLAAFGSVLVARLGEQVLAGLRERVVRRALEVPLADVERAGSGDVRGDIAVISEAVPLLGTAARRPGRRGARRGHRRGGQPGARVLERAADAALANARPWSSPTG